MTGLIVGTGGAAGQVIVEVSVGSDAAGIAVCTQLSVDVVTAAWGVQLKAIAGAFAPTVAGALIVRFAPAVIANAEVPVGIVHASATLAVATPAVATVTAAVPAPPASVTEAGNGLSVGATGVTVPAGQVKPQARGVGPPAPVSLQVKVAVPAVAARLHAKMMVPAVVTYTPLAGVVVTAPKVPPPTAPKMVQPVTDVEPPPVDPAGVTEIVVVAAPTAPAGNVTVVNAAFVAGA